MNENRKGGLLPLTAEVVADYPMVAPRYAEQRSRIARKARAEQLEMRGKHPRGRG